jgi:voltage-gated potassium channel
MKIFQILRIKIHRLKNNTALKQKLYDIIFESDTPAGKAFDVVLIICILLSILITIFDSLISQILWLKHTLIVLEYFFNLFFTAEYILRLYCSPNPKAYAKSFFGIIDLLSILPMYLGFFIHSARYALVLRSFRLIRIFRIFRLFSFLEEGQLLLDSIRNSFKKISIFFLFVLILAISLGTLMYMVEGHIPDTQFTSIPNSIYWAIVTITTVGYGDIAPVTGAGRFFSGIVMLLGYTIIAVPTGIFSASLISFSKKRSKRVCPNCGKPGHDNDAIRCKYCGSELEKK